MTANDDYSEWDAAYVLGSLDAAERREFEGHLAGCASCQSAVAELAGMPGLLAQVPPGEVLAMDHAGMEELDDPPVSLMPLLPAETSVVASSHRDDAGSCRQQRPQRLSRWVGSPGMPRMPRAPVRPRWRRRP
jgi:anti-sigma factor RsiW